MKFLSITDEWKYEAYLRIGDSIAFIFKHTYTATRIIINQLSIKCTRTRTITFPQLYNIRSNWKEGDEFLLSQKPLRTTLFLLLLPSLSITSIPHIHTQMWSSRRKELSMQVSLQAHPSEVEMIILHTLSHSSRTKVCDKPRTRREHKPREREGTKQTSVASTGTACNKLLHLYFRWSITRSIDYWSSSVGHFPKELVWGNMGRFDSSWLTWRQVTINSMDKSVWDWFWSIYTAFSFYHPLYLL